MIILVAALAALRDNITEHMNMKTIATTPFSDQRPGTSGLRKKTRTFMQPHYLENFVQSVFNAVRESTAADFRRDDLPSGRRC